MNNDNEIGGDLFDQVVRHASTHKALGFDPCPSTLATSPMGLNFPLTSFQTLMLKLVGISRGLSGARIDPPLATELFKCLDESNGSRRIWFPPGTKIENSGNNVKIQFERPIKLLLLIAGRRSGKTTLASILMAWLARRILKCENFLEKLQLLTTSNISLLNVACDIQQAGILFDMLKANLKLLDMFKKYTTSSRIIKSGRLHIHSLSSAARSARGRTACGICFDEFAHFNRTGGPLSDIEMWKALIPSLATFGDKSLSVISTTPAGRSGVVWDLFTQRGSRDGMLTVQVPTWVMNPNIPKTMLLDEFERDDHIARQEYGAEFLAPHGTFLSKSMVNDCVGKKFEPAGRMLRHIHVDIGLQNDATAIAMGHLVRDNLRGPCVIIEHLEILQGERDNPLKTSVIEDRLLHLSKDNNVRAITFDQHQSMYLVERLKSYSLNASVMHTTRKLNWESYKYLKDLITYGKISLPSNTRLLEELTSLQCDPTHNIPTVSAPPGKHDDCADAVALCAWCLGIDRADGWEDLFSVIEGV